MQPFADNAQTAMRTLAARTMRWTAQALRALASQVWRSIRVSSLLSAVVGLALALLIAASATPLRAPLYPLFASAQAPATRADNNRDKALEFLVKRCAEVRRRLLSKYPRGNYVVVATSDNFFSLYRDTVLVRRGMCSTGSFVLLKSRDSDKEWVFETPRGLFRVQDKEESPVWNMPDWAFVEEGRPIPPEGSPERVMYGVLGDYALALGHGYLIHGTLYQRFLGLPVTHGCVRLGDDDLEAVYRAIPVGGRVYIY